MNASARPRPVVLCVLCGLGEGDGGEGDAVKRATTPTLDRLRRDNPTAILEASGPAVGLTEGQAGNGELGHRVLGAGRVPISNRARIDRAIGDNKLGRNEVVDQIMRICLYDSCPLHLVGLLSTAASHAHLDHLFALVDIASFHEIPVVIHGILDGRDTPPKSAMGFIDQLETRLTGKNAIVGTLSGRQYAMDCEGRWERTYQAFHAMVRDKVLGPTAPRAETLFDAVSGSYQRGIFDELLEPVRIGDYQGMAGDFMADFSTPRSPWVWTGEDAGMAFNFRGDRMHQLSAMLSRRGLPSEVADDLLMDRQYPVLAFREHCFATLTSYGQALDLPVAFPSERLEGTVAEVIAKAGLKQLRVAERVKAAHVTHTFSGGQEDAHEGESRILVNAALLADSYEDRPAMRAKKVASAAVDAIAAGEHDFMLVTLANPDEVAHTGNLEATIAAIEAADVALGRIADAVRDAGGALLVTADHGNSESMHDGEGRARPGHTNNSVPFIYCAESDDSTVHERGKLEDVAATILDVMGLEQPEAMSGRSLRK